MDTRRDKTTFDAADFVSEVAVRGALSRRSETHPVPADAAGSAAQAAGTRRLRRWSVAELVAQAVPRAPAGGVAH